MKGQARPVIILMADDDEDDWYLTRAALRESRVVNELYTVKDGEDLMEFLYRRGRYSDAASAPRPDLILLDLNMPRKNGREALSEIRADPALRRIPIVVLTTSRSDEEIYRSYDLGANSFISKPVSFQGLIDAMRAIGRYWFEIVELPGDRLN